jgi:hypothetical protein
LPARATTLACLLPISPFKCTIHVD